MTEPLFPRPVAHRGLHDRSKGIIENSASAFEAAIAGNFAIECDLQLSNDGVPVVFHDDTLERLTGQGGRVIEHTAAELGEIALTDSASGDRPQTFDAFLTQIDGRTLLQVELKHQRDAEATRELNAGLLVMGAYGHSRMREVVMGGATRHMLTHPTGCAVLLAH